MNSISNTHPELMTIEWVCTNMCNYSCYYCAEDLHANTHGFPELETAINFYSHVHNDIYDGQKFISISGGEPTLWKDLAKFYNAITPMNYIISMTTNASRTIRWWKEFVEECDKIDRIDISVHLAYANLDHIISVCKILQDYTLVNVMIMMDPNLIQEGVNFAKKLSSTEMDISILIKPLAFRNGIQNVYQYEKDDIKFIESFSYNKWKKENRKLSLTSEILPVIDGETVKINKLISMIGKNQHSFTGWWCEIGKRRLVVRYDGTVTGAQCSTSHTIKLGDIKSGVISQIDGVICKNKYCDCIPDMRIPKWKIIDDTDKN